MQFSIASYSFHRELQSGRQDMFKYITDCKQLGCTQLDPWNGHLAPLIAEDEQIRTSSNPTQITFSRAGLDYVARVKAAADAVGLPFGCIAADGSHVWEASEEARAANHACAYRWLDVAHRLGAESMRTDTGGSAELPDDMFKIIVDGLQDTVNKGRELGVRVSIENHWGASNIPKNVVRFLDAVDGLTLLFDSRNWAKGMREEGWQVGVPLAKDVHIDIFKTQENPETLEQDLTRLIKMLVDAGYHGCWGIESLPPDGDEYEGIRKSMAFIEKTVAAL
ncbi:MAG: TIM barrel protein [Anaerolineaceae bacterium]|nr:TIM barrel protein [Anaerolineaceae bacterium]